MKINSLTAVLEEKSVIWEKDIIKIRDLFEEILNLRSLEEDFLSKNKTLSSIVRKINICIN